MSMWKEFKEFAIKGNALELAVGVVIGAAFGQIVNSLVNDVITPFISIFTGHVDFSWIKLDIFGHVIRLGSFVNALINFLLIAFAVFLVIKQINRFRRHAEPREKTCPFCATDIAIKATRCPHCTSELNI